MRLLKGNTIMQRMPSLRAAGAMSLLVAAVGLSGCGQSRDESVPRSGLDQSWVREVRQKAASESASSGGASQQTFDGWGQLKGRLVVVNGTVPPPPELAILQDRDYCDPFRAQGKLRNESVVVSPQGELMNVALYVSTRGVPAHESYAASANDVVELDNKDCRFEPHVLLLRTSQKLLVKNSDTRIGHNTKYDSLSQPFNANLPAGGRIEKQLTSEERKPTGVACDVHKWMNGYLVVRSSPYMAKTAADGTFELKNLPAGGKLEIEIWHERLTSGVTGSLTDVKGASTLTFERGKLSVVIPKDQTVEFKLEIPASAFGG
jgi:hypothetical protein